MTYKGIEDDQLSRWAHIDFEIKRIKRKMLLLAEAIERNGDVDPALMTGWIATFNDIKTDLDRIERHRWG